MTPVACPSPTVALVGAARMTVNLSFASLTVSPLMVIPILPEVAPTGMLSVPDLATKSAGAFAVPLAVAAAVTSWDC